METTNWFESKYSNEELADILSDYSKDVLGFRVREYGAGRCTLARQLENMDMLAEQEQALRDLI